MKGKRIKTVLLFGLLIISTAVITIFSMLGLNWVFGFFSNSSKLSESESTQSEYSENSSGVSSADETETSSNGQEENSESSGSASDVSSADETESSNEEQGESSGSNESSNLDDSSAEKEDSSENSSSEIENSSENSSFDSSESSSEDSSDEEESSNEEEPGVPHVHEYSLQVLKEPDCENMGISLYSCQCSHYYIENPAALGHAEVIDLSTSSTCVKHGWTEGSHCARCEKVLVEQHPKELMPHDYQFGYCQVCNLVGLEFVVDEYQGYATCTKYVGSGANVRRVEIPDTYYGYPVKALAPSLFDGCVDLYSVEIGANVEIIGEGAFHNCYHLVEIYDRSKAQVTKYDGVRNGGLTSYAEDDDIHYEPFESKIEVRDDFVLFHDEGKCVLLTYLGANKHVVIPEGVTELDELCLAFEYQMEALTIPTTVNHIERYAFYELTYVVFDEVTFLDPNGWQARENDQTEWSKFASGHLEGAYNGGLAVMSLFKDWEFQKVE